GLKTVHIACAACAVRNRTRRCGWNIGYPIIVAIVRCDPRMAEGQRAHDNGVAAHAAGLGVESQGGASRDQEHKHGAMPPGSHGGLEGSGAICHWREGLGGTWGAG